VGPIEPDLKTPVPYRRPAPLGAVSVLSERKMEKLKSAGSAQQRPARSQANFHLGMARPASPRATPYEGKMMPRQEATFRSIAIFPSNCVILGFVMIVDLDGHALAVRTRSAR
jgi:hypothetical protein